MFAYFLNSTHVLFFVPNFLWLPLDIPFEGILVVKGHPRIYSYVYALIEAYRTGCSSVVL